MTHDELLAKTRLGDGFQVAYSIAYALKTVIELHGPITEIDLEYDDGTTFTADFCATCCDDALYPCATIEAIEKALNA
jgi:hypothetical protein